jgi:hypothetical protein
MVVIDAVSIQQRVIEAIAQGLGPDLVWKCFEGMETTTPLQSVLRDVRRRIAPTISERTMRRWWYYFLKFGDTQASHRVIKRKKGPQRRGGQWTYHTTALLKRIVEDSPDLYLDEIQERLSALNGGWWDCSYIWRRLVEDCNYLLQVTTDRSYAANTKSDTTFFTVHKNPPVCVDIPILARSYPNVQKIQTGEKLG